MEALTTLALLLFLGFQINLVSSDTCAGDEPKWRFCDPRLSFTDDQKFPNQTCRCHNIVVFGQGDGDCASKVNGKEWCYIIGNQVQIVALLCLIFLDLQERTPNAKTRKLFALCHRTLILLVEACIPLKRLAKTVTSMTVRPLV